MDFYTWTSGIYIRLSSNFAKRAGNGVPGEQPGASASTCASVAVLQRLVKNLSLPLRPSRTRRRPSLSRMASCGSYVGDGFLA